MITLQLDIYKDMHFLTKFIADLGTFIELEKVCDDCYKTFINHNNYSINFGLAYHFDANHAAESNTDAVLDTNYLARLRYENNTAYVEIDDSLTDCPI